MRGRGRTAWKRSFFTRSLLFLRLDFRNFFPVLQLAFKRFYERVSKCVENGSEDVGVWIFERPGKRNFCGESIFWMVANNLGKRAEDRLPDELGGILGALFVEDHHVIEHRLDITLVTAGFRARFHGHLENAVFKSETAMCLREIV